MNGRMYRGTWLLVGIPLLLASLGIGRAEPLPPPVLPPAFDRDQAVALTRELSGRHPNRLAGTAQAAGATNWVVEELRSLGMTPERRPFVADVPGRGQVRLVNVLARVPGRTADAIVVMAHRDNLGVGPGGTTTPRGRPRCLELARTYAFLSTPGGAGGGAEIEPPARTIVFVSTDGGAIGGFGAAEFARRPALGGRIAAVLVLDSLGGRGPPRLQLAGDIPGAAPPASSSPLPCTSSSRRARDPRAPARSSSSRIWPSRSRSTNRRR